MRHHGVAHYWYLAFPPVAGALSSTKRPSPPADKRPNQTPGIVERGSMGCTSILLALVVLIGNTARAPLVIEL